MNKNVKSITFAAMSVSILLLAGCASKPEQVQPIPAKPVAADITRTMGQYNVAVGESVSLPVEGKLVQIGNQNLPASFGPDTMVFNVIHGYWLDGQNAFGSYQLIVSGVTPSPELTGISPATVIELGTEIGTAATSPVMLNLRCRSLDLYLCDTASSLPEYIDGWYYFGIGMLLGSSPKFLDYQEITSRNDEIPFWDYPETLEIMYESGLSDRSSSSGTVFNNYPLFTFCIKTSLASYPDRQLQFASNVQPATPMMVMQQFSNCDTYLGITYDEVPLQLFFQQGFDCYLKEEYTLGDPIWLYVRAWMSVNGELCCYVRDYTLIPPAEHALQRQENIRAALEEEALQK